MDRALVTLATIGHLHRRRLTAAVLLAAAVLAACSLPAACVLAAVVAWAWCGRQAGAMGAAARAARRLAARRIARGVHLAEAIAELLTPDGQIPTPAARARRRAPVTPPRSLPAAGVTLTPRLLPIPRTARA